MKGTRKALPPALLCPFMWSEIIPQTRDGPVDVWKPCLTVLGMGVGESVWTLPGLLHQDPRVVATIRAEAVTSLAMT